MTPAFRWAGSAAALAVTVMAPVMAFAACGGDDSGDARPASPRSTALSAGEPVEGVVTVFAASSLTEAFKEAATKFREKYPRARVTFNFAASSALATQINEGAPADVFASADGPQMKVVADRGNAADPVVFATNVPTLIVPKSGSSVQSFADLAKPGVRLVLAGPDVPIGRYARQIFANAAKSGSLGADFADRALANLRSNEANVRAVLTKVQLGEADAGVVYMTDAAIAGSDVKLVAIPAEVNVIAQYPVARLAGAKNATGARAWIDFVTGAEGEAMLAKYGFGRPGSVGGTR